MPNKSHKDFSTLFESVKKKRGGGIKEIKKKNKHSRNNHYITFHMITKSKIISDSIFNSSHSFREGKFFGSQSTGNIDLRLSPDFWLKSEHGVELLSTYVTQKQKLHFLKVLYHIE